MILIVLLTLFSTTLLADTQQIQDQSTAPSPQERQQNVYSVGPAIISNQIAFTGSAIPGSKEHAIAQHAITETHDILQGLTTEYVMLNYQPEQANPLYNQHILQLQYSSQKLTAIPASNPNQIFLFENLLTTSQQSLLATPPLCDTDGQPAHMIMSYDMGVTGTSDTSLHFYTLATVASGHGIFGDQKSGFHLIKHEITQEEIALKDNPDKKITRTKTLLIPCNTAQGNDELIKAIPLSIHEHSSAVSINGGIASIGNHVTVCWHPNLERFYIALQIKTLPDATVQQGGRALLIGRVDDDKLVLDPALPDDACQGMDKIIAATGPGQEVSLHKLFPFATSTGIPYLLIVGGNGSPEATKSMLFALPLVHRGYNVSRKQATQDALHGSIASTKGTTQALYGYDKKVVARLLTTPVTSDDNSFSCYDAALAVGNFAQLPGDITHVVSAGDAVFISVADAENPQQGGIFHSQAILDEHGRIAAWTQWQRFGGIESGVEKFSIQPVRYTITYLQSGAPLFGIKQWKQPRRHKKNEPIPSPTDSLEGLIETLFPHNNGGLTALASFGRDMPGLNSEKQELSLLVALGQKKVALIQTGSLVDEKIFTSHTNNFLRSVACVTSQAKSSCIEPARTLVFEDETLACLGTLTCATIATDGVQGWLVVGGPRGLAILCDRQGNGWPLESGINTLFAGKPHDYHFKLCGKYRFVQKLIGDNNNLYIITNKNVERLSVCSESFMNPAGHTKPIIQTKSGCIFDGSVSGPMTILATSEGLLYNPPGTDIRFEEIPLKLTDMHKVLMPYDSSSVYQLFFVTRTKREHDFACGAQLYASVGSLAENRTDIHRFYIDNVYEKDIQNASIRRVDDHLYRDKPTPFLTFNTFRSFFATDGAHYFSARSRQTTRKPFLNLIPQEQCKKVFIADHLCYEIPLQVHKANNIVTLLQNPATGCWIAAGDFGIRTHD